MKVLLLLSQLLPAFAQVPDANFWSIAPDGKSGAITATTTEADLKRMYGVQTVKDAEIYLGEGRINLFGDNPSQVNSQCKRTPTVGSAIGHFDAYGPNAG